MDEWSSIGMDFKKWENRLVAHKFGDAPLCPSSHKCHPGTYTLCCCLNQWPDIQLCTLPHWWNCAAHRGHDKCARETRSRRLARNGLRWILCLCWAAHFGWCLPNRPSASGVKNPDGTFSRLSCPTSDFIKSAGCCVLMTNFPDPDKLSAFRKVWDCWTHRLELLFRDICVDEQLVAFRDRCNFKQYMPTVGQIWSKNMGCVWCENIQRLTAGIHGQRRWRSCWGQPGD